MIKEQVKYTLLAGLLCIGCNDKTELIPENPEIEGGKTEWVDFGNTFVAESKGVLFDLTRRNGEIEHGNENGRNLYSADYILEVAGIPYSTTDDLGKAMEQNKLIFFSSAIHSDTFNEKELHELIAWVQRGGIIIAPAITDVTPLLAELFGISGSLYSKDRTAFVWKKTNETKEEMAYVDEVEEMEVSLGSIKTYAYTLSDGMEFACFNKGGTAVVCKENGSGRTYSFGLLWRDVIQRSQLNKDLSASRSYSNGFEPSADAFPLFVRSAVAKAQPLSVWKHTIPGGYQSVLIPTHDCDSRTAYDEMHWMAEYEKELNLKSHYFLTVHYFRDAGYLSDFYNKETVIEISRLLASGHTIGSHSIGHFPDFNKHDLFPLTRFSQDEYRPHHNVQTGMTTGGSTWAEIALSKQILEADLGNKVRSFRTGHLLMNKHIPIALQESGYTFSSCYGAGDVLSEFPFTIRENNDWSGDLTTVLEIPLQISDVFKDAPMKEDNWKSKPALWLNVINKLRGNYAPVVLLIHPNRDWKMWAQKTLIEQLNNEETGLCNFEDYGDFWIQRRNMQFTYCFLPSENKVLIKPEKFMQDTTSPSFVFALDHKEGCRIEEVFLINENGHGIKLKQKQLAKNRLLVYI